MILAASRTSTPTPRPTPAELDTQYRHVRVIRRVVTRLPQRDTPRRHCNGDTCFHPHAGGSRQAETRTGRRWVAA